MTFLKRKKMLLGVGAVIASTLTLSTYHFLQASDHAGTVETVRKPGTDLSDLHIFPGADPNNVVLAMSVRPFIPAGQATPDRFSFDQDVLYQFKIDTTGDSVEDLVIQAKFEGTGANQVVRISGPVRPSKTGTESVFEAAKSFSTTGVINRAFSPAPGVKVFAGLRADPFFIDLDQLFNIFPDRAVPPGLRPPPPPGQENIPMAPGFRPKGQAKDFLANFNVLAIVVELPKVKLGRKVIRVWETTSVARS